MPLSWNRLPKDLLRGASIQRRYRTPLGVIDEDVGNSTPQGSTLKYGTAAHALDDPPVRLREPLIGYLKDYSLVIWAVFGH